MFSSVLLGVSGWGRWLTGCTEGKTPVGGADAADVCQAGCRGMFFWFLGGSGDGGVEAYDLAVQILEPMADASARVRTREELAK